MITSLDKQLRNPVHRMKTLENLQALLREELPYLREHYHVDRIGIFGSYVRGEQTAESDLDVLVAYSETPTLFEIARLQHYLEDLLGVKVDVALQEGLKQYIAPYILREVQYV